MRNGWGCRGLPCIAGIDAAREAKDAALEAELAAELAAKDDEELLERLAATSVADPAALMPPFEYAGVVEGALRWRDAHGVVFGELDQWRWRMQLHTIVPGDYATKDEYMAAWRATEAAIEAATEYAYATVRAARIARDDDRRRWVQRPRAV